MIKVLDFNKPNKNGRVYNLDSFDLKGKKGEIVPKILYSDLDNINKLEYAVGNVNVADFREDGLYVDFSWILAYNTDELKKQIDNLTIRPYGVGYVKSDGTVYEYQLQGFHLITKEEAA